MTLNKETIILALVLFSGSAWACRPLTVDDCPPTDQGKIGFESGITSTGLPGYDKNISELTSVKYGLLKNMDIGVDLPYQAFAQTGAADVAGLGDVTVKAKVNLIPAAENSAGFSLVAGAKLATGNANCGLGSGATDYSINSILTKEFKNVSLHLNLGYTFVGQVAGSALKNVMNYGCAFEAPLAAGAKLLGEIYGSTNSDPTVNISPLVATLGANKELFTGLTADAGLSAGLNDAAPNKIITVGLTGTL